MPPNSTVDSEFAFLKRLERHFPREHSSLLKGRGDDCALVAWPDQALISTDLFVENVHFRRSYFSAWQIGHKALAVNLSDIAGMGGQALGFCLSIMAPYSSDSSLDTPFWDNLLAGMAKLATQWDAPLVGGDLSRGPCLGISVTVWGQSIRPLWRGKCQPGDALFVCSADSLGLAGLGLARAGFLALEALGSAACDSHKAATAAHLLPAPLLDAAPVLASHAGVHSLMDLSDGLATDLPRLLGAETAPHEGRRQTPGASLKIDTAALHPEFLDICARQKRSPLREALLGGEDYCLLGACSAQALPELQQRLPGLAPIGTVTSDPALRCNEHDFSELTGPGFDHFRPRE